MRPICAADGVTAQGGEDIDSKLGATQHRTSDSLPIDRRLDRLERPRHGHRRIGRKHNGHSGTGVEADRIESLGQDVAYSARHPVAKRAVVLRLRDRNDAGPRHPSDLVIAGQGHSRWAASKASITIPIAVGD